MRWTWVTETLTLPFDFNGDRQIHFHPMDREPALPHQHRQSQYVHICWDRDDVRSYGKTETLIVPEDLSGAWEKPQLPYLWNFIKV